MVCFFFFSDRRDSYRPRCCHRQLGNRRSSACAVLDSPIARRPCRRARARQVRLRSLPRGFSSRLWMVRSKKKHTRWCAFSYSATDGTRTRDFLLGKEVLYQLSHCRTFMMLCCRAFVTTKCIIPKKNGFVKEKSIIFRIFHIY